MTSEVKLPYYPSVHAVKNVTRFGMVEISHPQIYDTPIVDKVIVKADILQVLDSMIGQNCLNDRSDVYGIVSGNFSDELIQKKIAHYYRKFERMRAYVNYLANFGELDKKPIDLIMKQLREKVTEQEQILCDTLSSRGGKYLTTTHAYVYYAFKYTPELSDLEGVTIVC